MPRRRVLRLFALATVGTWLQSSGSLARAGLGRTQHVCDTRVAKEGWKYCVLAALLAAALSAGAESHAGADRTAALRIAYSTFVFTPQDEAVRNTLAVDPAGNAYLAATVIPHECDQPRDPFVTEGSHRTCVPGDYGIAGPPPDVLVAKFDPRGQLVWGTYLGGSAYDGARAIAVDAGGHLYVTGRTSSRNFATTDRALDRTLEGEADFFVTKLERDGSRLVYSTLLGGADTETAFDIAVDKGGSAYLVGGTGSRDFPVTRAAFATRFRGDGDAFVAKLDPSGSRLVYSTFLGGWTYDRGHTIAVDALGAAYVAGETISHDFPISKGAVQPRCIPCVPKGRRQRGYLPTIFVAKLHASGSRLVYSTFLGGGSRDDVADIAVDRQGSAYLTGTANSVDFPTTHNAFAPRRKHFIRYGAFVVKLSRDGTRLVYAAALAPGNHAMSMAVDAAGKTWVAGATDDPKFPTTKDALDRTNSYLKFQNTADIFLVRLHASGKRVLYSTFLGGRLLEWEPRIALGRDGSVYMTGLAGPDFPITEGAFHRKPTGVFLARLRP